MWANKSKAHSNKAALPAHFMHSLHLCEFVWVSSFALVIRSLSVCASLSIGLMLQNPLHARQWPRCSRSLTCIQGVQDVKALLMQLVVCLLSMLCKSYELSLMNLSQDYVGKCDSCLCAKLCFCGMIDLFSDFACICSELLADEGCHNALRALIALLAICCSDLLWCTAMIAAMSTHNGHRYCLVHDIHRFSVVVSCRFHLSVVIQLPHIRYHITHGFVLLCLEGVGKHVAHKAANQPTMRKHASIRFELATTSTATQSDAKCAALLNVLQRLSCAWLSLHLAERAAKEICNVRCVFVCLVCYILFVVLGVMWFCFECFGFAMHINYAWCAACMWYAWCLCTHAPDAWDAFGREYLSMRTSWGSAKQHVVW